MLLIVGGESSGKRSFAIGLGYEAGDISENISDGKPVIYHLEKLVSASPETADGLLPRLMEKKVVICNEVGSGIIPVDRNERKAREATGRLCVLLAQRADCVVRMVSGLPMVIKGELPCR